MVAILDTKCALLVWYASQLVALLDAVEKYTAKRIVASATKSKSALRISYIYCKFFEIVEATEDESNRLNADIRLVGVLKYFSAASDTL